MSKPKFKVGDVVRVRTTSEAATTHKIMPALVPAPGTVGGVEEIDSVLQGGRIRWTGEHGCYADRTWVPFEYVEPAIEAITIYRSGRSVYAKDLATGQITKAKCSPEDQFNFRIGAELAFDRLMGREEKKPEEPKYYTGDAVCVRSDYGWWTVGRIYPVVDGTIVDNAGDPRTDVLSIEQLNRRLSDDEAKVTFVPFRGVAPREFK